MGRRHRTHRWKRAEPAPAPPPPTLEQLKCRRKNRYSDEFAARAGAQSRLQLLGQPDGLSVYRCPHCAGWHLTSRRDQPRYFRVTDQDLFPKLTKEKQ